MRFIVCKMRTLQIALIVLLAAILLTLSYSGTSYASVYFGGTPRKIPVYSVDLPEKKVALTFDSAWGADKTLSILSTLKEYNVKATFFLVGFWVEEYPEMVQAIMDAGMEIGTHSNTHTDFTTLSAAEMRLELETSSNLIKAITKQDIKLFRCPYGSYNNEVISTVEGMGLQTIQWDVDTLDWKGLSAVEITNRVINKVKNGSIILCHNNSDNILEALPLMLDRLKLMGYAVTSVGDIVLTKDFTIDHTGMQKAK